MRLIDADALLERVDKEREYLIARGQTGAEHILVHNFRELVENAPTVKVTDYDTGYQDGLEDGLNDIRPQGEWINHEDGYNICPLCHYKTAFSYNFCPNCGTKMGGST